MYEPLPNSPPLAVANPDRIPPPDTAPPWPAENAPSRWALASVATKVAFPVGVLALVVVLNWFAICQAWQTGGWLCYQNAFDEISYLQYDYSRASQGFSRASQYLVTLGHLGGLSGAWINFLFDMVVPVLFLVVIRLVFLRLDFRPAQANLAALALALCPILFSGGYNPLLYKLFYDNLNNGAIYWVTAPQAWYLPVIRSPEPQFSLLLAALGVYLSLRWRSFLPAYLVAPFLYSFILFPYLYCLLCLHLSTWLKGVAGRTGIAAAVGFLLVSAGMAGYMGWLASPQTREFFCVSHLPQLSVTGAVALVLYVCLWWLIPVGLRLPGFFVALAPTVVANQQVVSGWFSAPHNFEQYFGVLAAALVLTLAAVPLCRFRPVAWLASASLAVLAVHHGYYSFQEQARIVQGLELSPELRAALRDHPAEVAINDPDLAAFVALVYPRQPTTVFGSQNAYAALASTALDRYRRAKSTILQDETLAPKFKKTFETLDHLYRYESEDFILLHSGRKTEFRLRNEVSPLPAAPTDPRPLAFLLRP